MDKILVVVLNVALVIAALIIVRRELDRTSGVMIWCWTAAKRLALRFPHRKNIEVAEKLVVLGNKHMQTSDHYIEFFRWLFHSKKSRIRQMEELKRLEVNEVDEYIMFMIKLTHNSAIRFTLSSVLGVQLFASLFGEFSLLMTRLGILNSAHDIIYQDVERIEEGTKQQNERHP